MKKDQTNIETRLIESIVSVMKENRDTLIDIIGNQDNPREVAVKLLVDKLDISSSEAYRIISRFEQGFEEYDKCRIVNENVEEYLLQHLKGYTDEEKREYIIEILLSFESLDSLSGNVEFNKRDLEQKKKYYECFPTDSLFKVVRAKLKDNNLNAKVFEVIDQIPLPGNVGKISDAVAKRKRHLMYAVAALLYIEMEDGNLDLFDENGGLTNFQLGSIAAGALDMMEANGDFASGKIDKSKWMSVVKKIVLALVMCTLSVVLLFGGVKLMVLLTGLLGGSLFVAIVVGYLIASLTVFIIDSVAEDLADFYNLCEKVIGKAVKISISFYSKVKSILSNVSGSVKDKCEGNYTATDSELHVNDEVEDEDSYCMQN